MYSLKNEYTNEDIISEITPDTSDSFQNKTLISFDMKKVTEKTNNVE
ncbi:unnamed protein product [marine sediment metagenome]|uniref:Uncharacterized protein n=1 Tax=marine sediment metagenome TaxID=412755 RepID=X1R8Q5_9ZZZZ